MRMNLPTIKLEVKNIIRIFASVFSDDILIVMQVISIFKP